MSLLDNFCEKNTQKSPRICKKDFVEELTEA